MVKGKSLLNTKFLIQSFLQRLAPGFNILGKQLICGSLLPTQNEVPQFTQISSE